MTLKPSLNLQKLNEDLKKQCRIDNVRIYRKIYLNNLKLRAYEVLGFVCQDCGSSENLHFHHKDPLTKRLNWSSGGSYHRYKDVINHPQWFNLLCFRCHRYPAKSPKKQQTLL